MPWQHQYVSEKLREFEAEIPRRPRIESPRRRKPVVGPVARKAGRALKRIGEGLEQWGAPSAREPYHRMR